MPSERRTSGPSTCCSLSRPKNLKIQAGKRWRRISTAAPFRDQPLDLLSERDPDSEARKTGKRPDPDQKEKLKPLPVVGRNHCLLCSPGHSRHCLQWVYPLYAVG